QAGRADDAEAQALADQLDLLAADLFAVQYLVGHAHRAPAGEVDRTKQPGGRTAAPPGVGTVARSPASVAGVARFVPLRSDDGTAAMASELLSEALRQPGLVAMRHARSPRETGGHPQLASSFGAKREETAPRPGAAVVAAAASNPALTPTTVSAARMMSARRSRRLTAPSRPPSPVTLYHTTAGP